MKAVHFYQLLTPHERERQSKLKSHDQIQL